IAVSYFGDGATDSGVFWESINFSALKQIPVLFVCEDNALSNVMHKSNHMFVDVEQVVQEFMPVLRADGTDVLSVYKAAGRATFDVRSKRQPMFLICATKRWMKHQGVELDDLPSNPVDRQLDCPIRKLETVILQSGMSTAEEIKDLISTI